MANAEENILAVLCGETVARDRDAEFAASDASSDDLHRRWNDLKRRIADALATLPAARLDAEMSHPRRPAWWAGRCCLSQRGTPPSTPAKQNSPATCGSPLVPTAEYGRRCRLQAALAPTGGAVYSERISDICGCDKGRVTWN
jgi:hypothetical protein